MFKNLKKLNNGRVRVKLIATMLVMILTFANFTLLGSYVGKAISSYAVDVDLNSQSNETNNENVKFEAYLDAGDKSIKEKTADINSTDLKLYLSIGVKGGGNLTNGKIEFENANFNTTNIANKNALSNITVQANKTITLEIPVVAVKDSLYNLGLLNMVSQIKLTGEYTDEAGNVSNIASNKMVKVNWTTDEITEEDIILNQEIITNKVYNINGNNKRVIQMLVTAKVKDNKAPIQFSTIEINNPEIGVAPEEVKVAGYNTKATNGKTSLEFGDTITSSWEYNADENKTYILVNNTQNDQNIVAWEKNCEDRFVVTYVYDENTVVAPFVSDAKATIELYGRTAEVAKKINKTNKLSLETLEDKGYIEKLESRVTKNIYKGNMYIGEDTDFETKANIYVPYSDLANKFVVEDLGESIVETEGVSTYYKTTKINKAEALKVLGTEGTIKVYNAENRTAPIQEILLSEETEDDYYTITYNEDINKIVIEMSAAQTEGQIEVINDKAIRVTDQVEVSEMTALTTNLKFTVIDENNSAFVNYISQSTANILEPVTKFDILLDKSSLSTQVENNLKITTELKSSDNSNKLFENLIIKIELPKEIKEVSLENISDVLYDNELKLKSHNIVTNEAGNKELVIELQGKQTRYNTSAQNATIVADLKVKTDSFMANQDVVINATCINGAENVQSKENIKLVSKTGLVTKNTLTIGTNVIQKVNQNTLSTTISEDTNVNISSSIINNFEENISNINIVGKIPEGTTLTNAVLSNAEGIEVSYSEETNPTVDASSWKTEVTDYSKIKSFKLTLSEMAKAGLIDLKYDLKANVADIKETTSLVNDLSVNYSINGQVKEEKIVFTLNVVKERTNPDVPETPDEPQKPEEKAIITITPRTTTNTLHEDQIITYEVKVKNTSTEVLNNVTLDYVVPEGAVVTELTYAQGSDITYTDNDSVKNKTWMIEALNPDQTATREITLRITDGAQEIINSANLKDAENTVIAQVTNEAVKVNKGNLSVRLSRRANIEIQLSEGSRIIYVVLVKNNTNTTMNNVKVTSKVPTQTSWVEDSELNENWNYDKNTNNVNYTIDTLAAGETEDVRFEVKVDRLNGTSAKIDNSATITTSSGEQYATNTYTSNVLAPKWNIHMTSLHNEILKEGDTVKYVIKVENSGEMGSTVYVTDTLPDQINATKIAYYTNPENKIEQSEIDKGVNVAYPVEIGEVLTIDIEGIVKELDNNIPSKKITNVAKIDLGDGEYLESEKIINTIVNDMQNPGDSDSDQVQPNSIAGIVWLDENKNGIRDNQEKVLQSIKVLLLDAKGNVVAETLTSLTGTYRFNEVANGDYMVAFEYDSSKYGLTKYQVQGANEKINSDVISKEITINNETKLVGITDTIKISDNGVASIDMGLIESPEFDLSLNKYVSKVVVTNKAGTSTYTYEDTELAKVEISAKQISGTVLLVEYEIEVTNEGDVNGYVTDIIDYLPKELEFNSEMNKEWYLGTDNYLHYMTLEPQAIEPGKTQKVKLVLTKTLKSNSTGTIDNIAEIGESTNLEGIKEIDSVAGNKQDGEDDIAKASLIVSIKTGSPMMYVGIVIISMIVLGAGIYIIDKKVLRVRI